MKNKTEKPIRKKQEQNRPGLEYLMDPKPVFDYEERKGSGRLNGKKVLITGGDSGIGRAIAVLFAKEGADVAIAYLNEHEDAKFTKLMVEKYDRHCVLIPCDITKEKNCVTVVDKALKQFDHIDILINNAAVHYESRSLEDISTSQLMKTFNTNLFPLFWLTKAVLPYMKKGGSIINTTSVTAYRGGPDLIDYATTKGAIVSFTRSLAGNLIKKGIRVNAVAPGPIWTPLIPSSFDGKKVAEHGSDTPMERAGEPAEVASAYLFLASEDASYISGQVIHPNGGEIVNG